MFNWYVFYVNLVLAFRKFIKRGAEAFFSDQQKVAANLFRNIFGEKLLLEPPEQPLEAIHHNVLPSPKQLRGKIILKHKKLVADANITSAGEGGSSSSRNPLTATPSLDKTVPICLEKVCYFP